MKKLHCVTFILLCIGGLNWGLYALGWGIDNVIPDGIVRLIYVLVGISAIIEIVIHKQLCRMCNKDMSGSACNTCGGSCKSGMCMNESRGSDRKLHHDSHNMGQHGHGGERRNDRNNMNRDMT